MANNLSWYASKGLITTDEKYARMSMATFEGIPQYSATLPTGVYTGKVWTSKYGLYDKTVKPEDQHWLFHWFSEIPNDPYKLKVNTRKVYLTDIENLLK